MCRWCDPDFDDGPGFSLVSREPETLVGRGWEGGFAEAAGARTRLLEEVRAASLAASARGPLVALTWLDRPGGLRCFVGYEPEAGEGGEAGLEQVELPALSYVMAWHDDEDGDVTEHYRGLAHWMEAAGIRRDAAQMDRREQHPLDAEPGLPPGMLLMVPALVERAAAFGRFRAEQVD